MHRILGQLMKHAIYRICINIILSLSIAIQGMSQPEKAIKKQISQQAWAYAFQGKYPEALASLQKAARMGSLKSALCLSQQYMQGGLLAEPNAQLAREYQALTNQLRQKVFAVSGLKKAKVQQKLNAMNAYSYAKEHEWFSKVIEFLSSKSKNKTFYPPLPEDAIIQTLSFLDQKNDIASVRDSLIPWLSQGIMECASEKLYKAIKKCELRVSVYAPLLISITHWALQHNYENSIKKEYESLLARCYSSDDFTIKAKIIRLYATFDIANACKWLTQLKDDSDWPVDWQEIEVLILAQEIDLEFFNSFAEELKDKEFDRLLEAVLENPYCIVKFQGTLLDVNKLIIIGLNTVFEREYFAGKRIFDLLASLDSVYYESFLPQLLEVLSKVLSVYPNCYEAVFKLLASPIPTVSHAALEALQNFYAHCDKLYEPWVLKGLLDRDLEQVAQDNRITGDSVTRHLNSKLQGENLEAKMQTLWVYLLGNSATTEIAQDMISFRIQGIKQASQASMPNEITKFLDAAEETGFQAYLSKDALICMQNAQIFNTAISLKKRASYLNCILHYIIEQAGEPSVEMKEFVDSLNFLEEGIFKLYANALVRAITIKAVYGNFKAKRELFELAAQESELDPKPSVLAHTTGQLFNAFLRAQKDDLEFVQGIDQEFIDPILTSNGLMFGYVADSSSRSFCLYACEAETGRAMWHSPIHSREKLKYVLWNNKVYIDEGRGKIAILNAQTGAKSQTINLAHTSDDSILEVSAQGMLYVVQKNINKTKRYALTCINLHTNLITYSIVIEPAQCVSLIKDSLLVCRETQEVSTLELYGPQNSEPKLFKLPIKNTRYPYLVFTEAIAYCPSENESSDSYTLGCYDFVADRTLWNIKLQASLTQQPIVTADRIYIITQYEVIALQVKAVEPNNQILWRVPIEQGQLQIMLSDEKDSLYGIDGKNGNLYKYDIGSGDSAQIGNFKKNREQKLLRIKNNKMYIRAFTY